MADELDRELMLFVLELLHSMRPKQIAVKGFNQTGGTTDVARAHKIVINFKWDD